MSSGWPSSSGWQSKCPGCEEPLSGIHRFCEHCGYDLKAGVPSNVERRLSLVLSASRERWERMVGQGEPAFPGSVPSARFELTGDHVTLGRAREESGEDLDIALAGPATDPAVSHRQCELVRQGGRWIVRDLGSANGTWINDASAPLGPDEEHTVADGDRILIGAWTCLTVRIDNQ